MRETFEAINEGANILAVAVVLGAFIVLTPMVLTAVREWWVERKERTNRKESPHD